ncbi:putative F-box domain-containing protein [Helianthus anomalus]
MGSALSCFLLMGSNNNTSYVSFVPPESNLGDLPESVVVYVLVYLNPQEICRVVSVNRTFRRASTAEFVWESK